MLSYLHLRNFALIDNLSLDFFPGLNVLTGETGAGKSILLDALGLLLGERASAEQLRTGSEYAFIEAVFSPPSNNPFLDTLMEENGLSSEEEIVISREISLSGRNLCRINGRVVPLVTLKKIGSFLVDMHGQHSHQSLLKTEHHLFLLDEFGDKELSDAKTHYQQLFSHWQEIDKKLRFLGKNSEERKRQLELLSHQYKEIMDASLSAEEEEILNQKLTLLDNLEKILFIVHSAYTDIYSGNENSLSITDKINTIRDNFAALQKIDPKLTGFIKLLDEASANLSELGHELYAYQDSLNYQPDEKMEIENRLETYLRLKRKYQLPVDELLSFAQQCREQIRNLGANEEEALSLEKEYEKLSSKVQEAARHLLERRKITAQKLKSQVEAILNDLGIEKGTFSVSFTDRESLMSSGGEEIEFLFSANPGEDPKPLAKIISAGEMSRVMLALKCILAEQDRIPTLVFDEIDSGWRKNHTAGRRENGCAKS